jgi:hypothetical protein
VHRIGDQKLWWRYLPQITNLRISNRNPLDYLGDYMGATPHERAAFLDVLKGHLVPEVIVAWQQQQTLAPDALRVFIELRLDLVVKTLTQKLGDVPMNFYDSEAGAVTEADVEEEGETSDDA